MISGFLFVLRPGGGVGAEPADVSSMLPTLGASGAIAGVLAAYVVLFPTAAIRTLLFIVVIPLPVRIYAWILIGFWLFEQLFNGVSTFGPTSQQGGVAFIAQIGGFVCGLVPVLLFPRRNPGDIVKQLSAAVASRGRRTAPLD